MKYFCFRFDVDTPKCIKKGVPNLISLSKKLDVPFTFFIKTQQSKLIDGFYKTPRFIDFFQWFTSNGKNIERFSS
jgi:hypothetical protein